MYILFYCNIILHILTYLAPAFCVQTEPKISVGKKSSKKKSWLESLQENKVKTWPVRSLTLAWLHATAESTHFRIFISSLSSVFMMRCRVQSTIINTFQIWNMQGCDSHFAAAVKWFFENTLYSGERILNSYSRSYTMTSPSETNSLPLKNGGLKDLPFWYGATWLVRVILVPKVPFIVMGI